LPVAAASRRVHRVRFAIRLLVPLTAVALVACSGGDETDPPPLSQRFLTAADAPGTKPDPVETRETTVDFDEFIAVLGPALIDPDEEEMTTVFQEAGFKGAGVDARFFGETHDPHGPHVFSSFIELESEDGATSTLDWLETETTKPCPMTCARQTDTFDVDDIADDARGVHSIATAEGIETAGTEQERPFESYWVAFSNGAVVYAVDLHGPPGSVSEEQALEIARAYHDRITGS